LNELTTAAVIGGAMTGAATLIGAAWLRWLDKAREADSEARRYQAALLLVSDELDANMQMVRLALSSNMAEPPAFAFRTYEGVQMILALHLNADERLRVAKAFEPVRVTQALGAMEPVERITGHLDRYFAPNINNLNSAFQKMTEAKALLGSRVFTEPPPEPQVSLYGRPNAGWVDRPTLRYPRSTPGLF